MIVVKVAISPDSSSACSTPVRTVTSEPSSVWILRVSSSGREAVLGGDLDRVELSFLVQQVLGCRTSRIANVAPPSELRSPYLAIPTIRTCSAGAKCLAYLVASPRLLDANCRTIEQMRLANALCRFVETAATTRGT